LIGIKYQSSSKKLRLKINHAMRTLFDLSVTNFTEKFRNKNNKISDLVPILIVWFKKIPH